MIEPRYPKDTRIIVKRTGVRGVVIGWTRYVGGFFVYRIEGEDGKEFICQEYALRLEFEIVDSRPCDSESAR